MVDKEGWVYVLTNDAMPELVKIGYTMNDPAIRAEELSSDTGVPLPFVVAYKALVVNPKQIEQEVHANLDSKRLNDKREFFKCEPFEAIRYIRDTTTIKYEESKEDVDRRIQQQKELEEQDRIRRQEELERQRIKKEQAAEREKELEEEYRLEKIKRRKEIWMDALWYDFFGKEEINENLYSKIVRYVVGVFKLAFRVCQIIVFVGTFMLIAGMIFMIIDNFFDLM